MARVRPGLSQWVAGDTAQAAADRDQQEPNRHAATSATFSMLPPPTADGLLREREFNQRSAPTQPRDHASAARTNTVGPKPCRLNRAPAAATPNAVPKPRVVFNTPLTTRPVGASGTGQGRVVGRNEQSQAGAHQRHKTSTCPPDR